MKKYSYIKKYPKTKAYKGESKATSYIKMLEKRRRAGIIILLIGIIIIIVSFNSNLNISGRERSTSIINPLPLSAFAQGVEAQNKSIDAKTPLDKYIPEEISSSQESNYNGSFNLSFPSLGLNNIKVKANVDSKDQNVYEKVLADSTAHFKGTPLPGEKGNSFIYGHSSNVLFHTLYPYSYLGIFTALFDLQIGDQIKIDLKGTEYSYVVEGIQVIKATDFSQIQNIKGVDTLTLMTCDPPGVGDKRLIVRAVQE